MSTRKEDRMKKVAIFALLGVSFAAGHLYAAEEDPSGDASSAPVSYPTTEGPSAPVWRIDVGAVSKATAVTRGFKNMYEKKIDQAIAGKQAYMTGLDSAIARASQALQHSNAETVRDVFEDKRRERARCQQEIAVLSALKRDVVQLPDNWSALGMTDASMGEGNDVASYLNKIATHYEEGAAPLASESAAQFYGLYQEAHKRAQQSRRLLSSSREDRRARDRSTREQLEGRAHSYLQQCARSLQERFTALEVAVRSEVALLHAHALQHLWPSFSSWLSWQGSETPLADDIATRSVHIGDIQQLLSGESAPEEVTAFFAETGIWQQQAQAINLLRGDDLSRYLDEGQQKERDRIMGAIVEYSDRVCELARTHGQAIAASQESLIPNFKGVQEAEKLRESADFYLKSERGLTARMRLLNECAQLARRIARKMQPVLTASSADDWRRKEVKNAMKVVLREAARLDNGTQQGMWAWLKEKMRQAASRLSELPGIRRKMNERFAMLSTLHPDAGFVGELLMEGIERFAPGLTADTSDDGESDSVPQAVAVPPASAAMAVPVAQEAVSPVTELSPVKFAAV